jgi:tetratricopeptide (TPR) repeat protein
MVLVTHGFQAEGMQCLVHAEQLDPRELRWPYFQGVTVVRNDPATGIPKLQRAVELAPADAAAPRLRLAEALLGQGRWDDAAGLFAQVLAQDADNPRALLGLGRAAREQGRLDDSAAYLRRCADSPFSRQTAHSLLAEIYEVQGDHAAAARAARLADSLPQDSAWSDPLHKELDDLRVGVRANTMRATGLMVEEKIPEALAVLEQTVREYPDVDYAWVAYGRALLVAQDLESAEAAFRRALRVSPDMAEAHFYQGVALYEQKKYAEAAPSFRRAAEIQPTHAWAHYNLGQCLKETGKRPQAAESFCAAARARPQFAEAHRELGALLAEAGNDAEALAELQQAGELAPDDAAAQQLLEQVRKKATQPPP